MVAAWEPPWQDLPPQPPHASTCCMGCPGGSKPKCCRAAMYRSERLIEARRREAAALADYEHKPGRLARLLRRRKEQP